MGQLEVCELAAGTGGMPVTVMTIDGASVGAERVAAGSTPPPSASVDRMRMSFRIRDM